MQNKYQKILSMALLAIWWNPLTWNWNINLRDVIRMVINQEKPQIQLTAQPDSTANWKTYTNSNYGFEIKYPESLSLKQDSDSMFAFEDQNHLSYYILNIVNSAGIKKSAAEEINYPVNGVGTTGSVLNTYIEKADKTYAFKCINCNSEIFGSDGANRKNTFDQMLSTFKFINK